MSHPAISPRRMLRVVVADGRSEVRSTLKSIVERWGWCCVGEASDGLSAMRMARENAPDLLLADGSINNGMDLQTLQRYFRDDPRTLVVGLLDQPLQHAGMAGVAFLKSVPLAVIHDRILAAISERNASPARSEAAR